MYNNVEYLELTKVENTSIYTDEPVYGTSDKIIGNLLLETGANYLLEDGESFIKLEVAT